MPHSSLQPGCNDVVTSAIHPCDWGVIFALGIESGCFEDMLHGLIRIRANEFAIREGGLHRRRVAVILAGAGCDQVARAAEVLIDGHRPRLVVSAGFAGALSDTLSRNDILLADRLVDIEGEEMPVSLPASWATSTDMSGVRRGALLTTRHVVRLPSDKAALFHRFGTVAVDMETFAAAEVCRRRGIPFVSVRVINDTADETLPEDVEHLLNQKTGPARFGAALGVVWRRPGVAKDLYRLRENALIASRRLAQFLAAAPP